MVEQKPDKGYSLWIVNKGHGAIELNGGRHILNRRLLLLILVSVSVCLAVFGQNDHLPRLNPISDQEFQQLSLSLSEKPGFFGTDNLVSNETSYLHVKEEIQRSVQPGGAYIGVGPDQNFTYIGISRPSIAFILDIRRDNLLHHLYYKSIFMISRDRWDFLSLLFGKPIPEDKARSSDATAEDLLSFFKTVSPDADFGIARFEQLWQLLAERYPDLALPGDRFKVLTIASRFFEAGFDVKYEIPGRPMLSFFPTYGQLMIETDLKGKRGHYLESEGTFQFLKGLQEANRIIPVTGNFAGVKALKAVGQEIRKRGLTISILYLSNVEFYLFRSRTHRRFVDSVQQLPIDSHSLMIRSYFNNWFGTWRTHPHAVPDYFSTSLAQFISRFLVLDNRSPYTNYWEMVNRDYLGREPGLE